MTATKEITIAGVTVTVSTPYAAGHVVTEDEARALNTARCDEIRKALAGFVKTTVGEADEPSDEALTTIGNKVAEYDRDFSFALRQRSPAAAADPLEVEIREVAIKALKGALKKAGLNYRGYEHKDEKLAILMQHPKVIAQAKKNLASDLADIAVETAMAAE